MAKRFGAFLLGAALLSALFPKKPQPAAAPEARPSRKSMQKPLYALVQTHPQALVLAISDSPCDLEKEMEELKATLDGPNSDARGHSFEIQPACLLQTKRDEFPRLTNA